MSVKKLGWGLKFQIRAHRYTFQPLLNQLVLKFCFKESAELSSSMRAVFSTVLFYYCLWSGSVSEGASHYKNGEKVHMQVLTLEGIITLISVIAIIDSDVC